MIVQFRPRTKGSSNRVEALVKGEIRTFNCNACGGEFEVLFNRFPEDCPHCGLRIDWDNSKYNEENSEK